MLLALCVAFAAIPAWAFGGTLAVLTLGAIVMQIGVQGTWGIIPAHLNELSPHAVRGLLPGFAYQIGVLIAAPTNSIEYALCHRLGYGYGLAVFEGVTILLLAIVISLGREDRGRKFIG